MVNMFVLITPPAAGDELQVCEGGREGGRKGGVWEGCGRERGREG